MKNKKVMSYTERKEEEQRQKELALEELRQDHEKKKQEEFDEWKDMITEEESGNKIDEKVSEEELIEKFIEFIRVPIIFSQLTYRSEKL